MNSDKNSGIIFYEGEDKNLRIKAFIKGETVWLNQTQLAELFHTTKQLISYHLKNIFDEKELAKDATVKEFLTVQNEGEREVSRNIEFYNLDVIISLGYRINSKIATAFRQWATLRLKEYIIKGFTLDDERLKQNGGRYFKELLQRVRDIRSSERNLWQQVTDIYATSIDYDKNSETTKKFFATVQNKMHYAVHQQTAAEVIYNRVNSEKPMIGMTNFKGDYITKADTHIAKNYLKEDELNIINLLVSRFLDYAELQAISEKAMTMNDWKERLDMELKSVGREILPDNGKISHEEAIKKADTEYDKYRQKEFENYESDFDRAVEELTKEAKRIRENKDEAKI